jgi:hypothetical protein
MCKCIQLTGDQAKRHDVGCKEGYPNPPHVHAELIKAWADGAKIQYQCSGGDWRDVVRNSPTWNISETYRIKPEPKPDVVQTLYLHLGGAYPTGAGPNIKAIFDGETGVLKDVQLIKKGV